MKIRTQNGFWGGCSSAVIIDENGGGGIEAELAASILVGLLKERKFTRIIAAVVRTRHGLSSRAGELRGLRERANFAGARAG